MAVTVRYMIVSECFLRSGEMCKETNSGQSGTLSLPVLIPSREYLQQPLARLHLAASTFRHSLTTGYCRLTTTSRRRDKNTRKRRNRKCYAALNKAPTGDQTTAFHHQLRTCCARTILSIQCQLSVNLNN